MTTRRYRSTFAVSMPVALLVASSISLLRSDIEIGMAPGDTRYIELSGSSTVSVVYDADVPINAIGATIRYPSEAVAVTEISLSESSLDLWTEQPQVDTDAGTIRFSGGSIVREGLVGPGDLFSFTFVPLATGTIVFSIEGAEMLAHDGKGTMVDAHAYQLAYFVRGGGAPSPDVNNDRTVNLLDFGIVSARLFGAYEDTYDLNRDGAITIADLRIVVRQFFSEGGF